MTSARIVKAAIEKTMLGEISEYICEVYNHSSGYLSVKLDLQTVSNLHLNVSGHTVKRALLSSNLSVVSSNNACKPSLLRSLKEKHVVVYGDSHEYIKIFPPEVKETHSVASKANSIPSSQRIYFSLQALKATLPYIIVQGIPTISRAVINEDEEVDSVSGKKSYHLLVEGYGKLINELWLLLCIYLYFVAF